MSPDIKRANFRANCLKLFPNAVQWNGDSGKWLILLKKWCIMAWSTKHQNKAFKNVGKWCFIERRQRNAWQRELAENPLTVYLPNLDGKMWKVLTESWAYMIEQREELKMAVSSGARLNRRENKLVEFNRQIFIWCWQGVNFIKCWYASDPPWNMQHLISNHHNQLCATCIYHGVHCINEKRNWSLGK